MKRNSKKAPMSMTVLEFGMRLYGIDDLTVFGSPVRKFNIVEATVQGIERHKDLTTPSGLDGDKYTTIYNLCDSMNPSKNNTHYREYIVPAEYIEPCVDAIDPLKVEWFVSLERLLKVKKDRFLEQLSRGRKK